MPWSPAPSSWCTASCHRDRSPPFRARAGSGGPYGPADPACSDLPGQTHRQCTAGPPGDPPGAADRLFPVPAPLLPARSWVAAVVLSLWLQTGVKVALDALSPHFGWTEPLQPLRGLKRYVSYVVNGAVIGGCAALAMLLQRLTGAFSAQFLLFFCAIDWWDFRSWWRSWSGRPRRRKRGIRACGDGWWIRAHRRFRTCPAPSTSPHNRRQVSPQNGSSCMTRPKTVY